MPLDQLARKSQQKKKKNVCLAAAVASREQTLQITSGFTKLPLQSSWVDISASQASFSSQWKDWWWCFSWLAFLRWFCQSLLLTQLKCIMSLYSSIIFGCLSLFFFFFQNRVFHLIVLVCWERLLRQWCHHELDLQLVCVRGVYFQFPDRFTCLWSKSKRAQPETFTPIATFWNTTSQIFGYLGVNPTLSPPKSMRVFFSLLLLSRSH